MDNSLIGIWRTDPNDIATQQAYGNTIMEFRDNGELIYTIIEGHKEQKIFMTYEVADDFLVTDQLSFPKKEKTRFILDGKKLELDFDGMRSRHIKVEP